MARSKKVSLEATVTRAALIAEDTFELEFDLGGATVEFAAGQYARVVLPTLHEADRKTSRKFSIVNAPHDNHRLVIATRAGITGYKCTLCALQPGDPVRIEKVKGDLVLPDRPRRPLVFIAGGIGIAPFISMLRDLDHRDRLSDVTLLYFNRTPESAPYLAELQRLARGRPGFRLVLSMTRHPTWVGETERLGSTFLTRLLGDLVGYDYYVVGTPAMVDATVDTLRGSDVPERQIFDEDFSGYENAA